MAGHRAELQGVKRRLGVDVSGREVWSYRAVSVLSPAGHAAKEHLVLQLAGQRMAVTNLAAQQERGEIVRCHLTSSVSHEASHSEDRKYFIADKFKQIFWY